MRALRLAERTLDAVAVVVFLAMFGAICVQVLLRYVFNAPLVWSDEFAQYCFVWIAFIGVVRAARHRTHIGITALIERLPAGVARLLRLVWQLAAIGFAGLLLWYGYAIIVQNLTVTMTSMPLPYWPVYAIVPVAAVFLIAYAVRDARDIVSGREPPPGGSAL
jgi:TRAP-type C4-dicarboxylate transport system permease small subunit